MSQSLSDPWIRDYLLGVAETYGAQLYTAPVVTSIKKKVQFIDFLTYRENSYVWAWISDKDYKVSVRISQDAANMYKTLFNESITSSRFFVVTITRYRPMFSPRPRGPKLTGNTSIYFLSLEIEQVALVGHGAHLFGNPRDLELDESIKEWVQGLRQDGGGGNVLKRRKQQLIDNEKVPAPPPAPPPPLLRAPVSQCQAIKVSNNNMKTKHELPPDSKRTHEKRWKIHYGDKWKFVSKSETKELPNLYPTPHCTPSPTPKLQRQGTPTDWSPSNRGSPAVSDRAAEIDKVQQHDEAGVTAVDTHSLQTPTPAQRIRRSPPLTLMSPRRGSPEAACSSPQQLPCSIPPLSSSSFSIPSSFSPITMSVRKNIQRKVPHPGLPAVSASEGPPLILVPNSDTSGAGSCSQSQHLHPSQSRPSQLQLLSRSPAFPSSLATNFEPFDASTPREAIQGGSMRRTSKMLADSLPTYCNIDVQEMTPKADKSSTEKPVPIVQEQEGLDSTRPPPSSPKIGVLEVGTSDIEEETGPLHLALRAKDDHPSADKIEAHSTPQTRSPSGPSPTTPLSTRPPPSNGHGTTVVSIQRSQSPERPGSRSPLCSLFSNASEAGRTVPSRVPGQPQEDKAHEEMKPTQALRHDPEAWKEPSFIARSKRKGKAPAAEEPETLSKKAGQKRPRSTQLVSPAPKRVKVAEPEAQQGTSGQAVAGVTQIVQAPPKIHLKSRSDTIKTPTPSVALLSSKPRLSNLVVDFEKIDLGERVLMPMADAEDISSILLRTGRIRTLGKEIEKDGRAYIMRR